MTDIEQHIKFAKNATSWAEEAVAKGDLNSAQREMQIAQLHLKDAQELMRASVQEIGTSLIKARNTQLATFGTLANYRRLTLRSRQ